jgi:hypothetical protein
MSIKFSEECTASIFTVSLLTTSFLQVFDMAYSSVLKMGAVHSAKTLVDFSYDILVFLVFIFSTKQFFFRRTYFHHNASPAEVNMKNRITGFSDFVHRPIFIKKYSRRRSETRNRTMDKVRKPSNSVCYTTSSEPFRI